MLSPAVGMESKTNARLRPLRGSQSIGKKQAQQLQNSQITQRVPRKYVRILRKEKNWIKVVILNIHQ